MAELADAHGAAASSINKPSVAESTAVEKQSVPGEDKNDESLAKKEGIERFVGAGRSASDIWWLRERLDELQKNLKVYGDTFEYEKTVLERAVRMFGDQEPEEDDPDAGRSLAVKKRPMSRFLFDRHESTSSAPAIIAYYNHLPSSSPEKQSKVSGEATAEPSNSTEYNDFRSAFAKVQRIKINSDTIIEELQDITGLSLGPRLVFAHPFKLFTTWYQEMGTRLSQLHDQYRTEFGVDPPGEAAEKQFGSSGDSAEVAAPEVAAAGKAIAGAGTAVSAEAEIGQAEVDNILTPLDPQALAAKTEDATEAKTKELGKHQSRLLLRINSLKTLMEFLGTSVDLALNFRDGVGPGKIETVLFEDLWHLFRPGDLLISTEDGRTQLYQAYHITGGLSRKRRHMRTELDELRVANIDLNKRGDASNAQNLWGSTDDKETRFKAMADETILLGSYGPLVVNCFTMVFDGSYYGFKEHYKSIDHFNGPRKITDLPTFPLRFHPEQERIHKEMTQRGRSYMNAYGHKSYDGLVHGIYRGDSMVLSIFLTMVIPADVR